MQLWHAYPNGEPVKNAPYRVDFPDGSWRMGKLDDSGRGTVANIPRGGGAVKYFEDGYAFKNGQRKWADPKNAPGTQSAVGDEGLAPPSLTGPAMAAASHAVTQAAPDALQALASQAAQSALSSIGQQLGQTAQSAVAQPLASIGQQFTKPLTSK